jgi:hypothetical protein
MLARRRIDICDGGTDPDASLLRSRRIVWPAVSKDTDFDYYPGPTVGPLLLDRGRCRAISSHNQAKRSLISDSSMMT